MDCENGSRISLFLESAVCVLVLDLKLQLYIQILNQIKYFLKLLLEGLEVH